MKFFVDTADVESIRDLVDGGFVDGVTTTPELISATGRPVEELVAEICEAVEGPVSVDLLAGDCESMVDQGCALSDVAPNVAVKLPMTLSFWQIWNMCFGFLGIQFGFALQNGNVSRIFQTLGANVDDIPILWVAAPLTGLIVQPIIGYWSAWS